LVSNGPGDIGPVGPVHARVGDPRASGDGHGLDRGGTESFI
jgi:hypothetical protein